MNVSGYKESPYDIEWIRFVPGCSLPELVKSIPHAAFEADDLERELERKMMVIEL